MLPLSRIVVPINFSDQCRDMLRYARIIAARYNGEITLLHVVNPVYAIPPTGISGPGVIPAPASVIAEKTEEMERFGADELSGVAVRRLVYEGTPVEQIAGFVRTEGMQLVAMPTHGLGVLRRFLIGSVTAKVLHDVECPVLTGVHMSEPPHALPATFANILCALDLGEHSQRTLAWAVQFAKDFDARLSIVHAAPGLRYPLEHPFGSDWHTDVTNTAHDALKKLQTATGSDASEVYVQEGETAKTVCSFAKSSGADLLIVGRGSQAGLAGRLLTNAYAIIRESPCPVISV